MRSSLLAAWLCAAPLVCAQTDYYPFGIDQDNLSGAVDFSFLNHPLTPADRLFVREGHFYRVGADLEPNTGDDERVRLFGVNLAFGANFPTADDAPRIARRLRALGVNLVRLHHMDSSPDSVAANAGSILTQDPYPTLNPVSAGRLRAFLDALSQQGIYCDLNLHVGYTFRPSVDQLPDVSVPTQSKPLQIFYPRMVDLQLDYARNLIGALALQGDPVLGVVEIDNESSLVYSWQVGEVDRYVTGEYLAELGWRWNQWLAAKYSDTATLGDAWGATEPDGGSVLADKWSLEVHSPAQAIMDASSPELVVRVIRGGAPVIAKQVGFSISTDQDQAYIAEVEMRAELAPDTTRGVYMDVKQDVSPWNTEMGQNVSVSNAWRTFRMMFKPSFPMEGIGRLGLSVENLDAPIHIRNARVYTAGRRGLDDSESIEAGNISVVWAAEYGTDARTNDYLLFLTGLDREYLERMLGAVRDSTDALVPVAGTQVGFGGFLNYDSHAALDYQDNHFYVDHYGFPNLAWDGRDWTTADISAVGTGLTAMLTMAFTRQAGRPYTVSEFNQPWPNRQAAEIDPLLSVFGAFQDWDAVMHFAYSHGRNWDDGVPNGFNLNGDWTKFPGFGQSAWLFRTGIQSGREPIDLPVPLDLRLRATRDKRNGGGIPDVLASTYGLDTATAFVHPVRLVMDVDAQPPDLAGATPPGSPFEADSGELTYDRDARVFLIHTAQAAGVLGFAGTRGWTAGAIEVELAPAVRGFVALLATALDGQPLVDSARILVSNPGSSFRTQPALSPARRQELVHYPNTTLWTLEPDPRYPGKPSGDLNGGSQPTYVERIELYLTLTTSAGSITVYPLDGTGRRLAPLPAGDVVPVEGGFRLHLQADGQAFSPWYEVVR